jgi:nucleoside-diphosphate-sugar epimerase
MENHGRYGTRKVNVLVTGHDGYIGSIMVPVLQEAGYQVAGMDMFYYSNHHADQIKRGLSELQLDIRDCTPKEMIGYDAVIHLAALSNDPLSEINQELTFEINHTASVKLAKLAKEAGVKRFLYASTCSVYGTVNQDEYATEDSFLHPLTPYATSKVKVEADLSKLADESFSPIYLRNATAYGWSPNFRSDLVLNNLVCWAYTTGEIRIMSDGTPWRPITHVRDICNAFATVIAAPKEVIHNQAFNVGVNQENYQVRDLAAIVQKGFPACKVTYSENGGPDPRSYRVDFSKISRCLPEFKPIWRASLGVSELKGVFEEAMFNREDFIGQKYVRLAKLKNLLQERRLDNNLRWRDSSKFPIT